jgi:hypothetical protein
MTIYKKVIRKQGSVNYFRDGKYIKMDRWDALPPEVLEMKEGELKIEELPPTPEPVNERVSVVSGEPGTHQRYFNGTTYWLTEEEYRTLSLGKIAQVVRERLDTCDKKQ